jgi:uncharacterized protein (TIGR01777 family)
MIIAITGSSGLVGSALIHALEGDGHLIRPVVRRAPRSGANEIRWDPDRGTVDATEFAGVDAVVHLAGENIAAHRWTRSFKDKILASRVRSTKLLCDTLASLASKPSVLISASAIGYYGSRGSEPVDESATNGRGFLAEVCQQWEGATSTARDADIRVVNLRIGFVLSKDGGGLAKMLMPFRLGGGGVIGSGQQYMSWVALDDLVRVIQFTLSAAAIVGPVNAVAPNPVTNREFTKTLGGVLHRPTILPLPAFAAKLALGEMADDMLLSSIRVEPHALSNARFEFRYPQLDAALRHILA